MDSISIEITRKSIKRMNLRVYPPDGLVKVSAPLSFSEKLIRQHLQDKIPWITTVRERFQKTAYPKDELLETGKDFEFRGKRYELIIEEHNGPSMIKIQDQFIYCYTQPNTSQAQLKQQFEQWLRREMSALLPELFSTWQAIIGVKVNEWGIKKMKTRWGSCNTRVGRIWLNLSLIQKPPICLEYVVVHELVHLLEASHNSRFHAFMTHFMPEWKQHKKLLEGKLDCA
jgi:predicted metal-dependent hydrolase